jgi:hypothetical protein
VVTCVSGDRRYNSANPHVYEEITQIMAARGGPPDFFFTGRPGLKPYETYDKPRSALILAFDDDIQYAFDTL